jgi:hypothetical protein
MHPLLMFINPVRDELQTAGRDLALALEADLRARNDARTAKQAYDDAEVIEVAIALDSATGKNAESRKAEVEARLVVARGESGDLQAPWLRHQQAVTRAAETAVALEAAKACFSLAKADAALVAAALAAEPIAA